MILREDVSDSLLLYTKTSNTVSTYKMYVVAHQSVGTKAYRSATVSVGRLISFHKANVMHPIAASRGLLRQNNYYCYHVYQYVIA